MTSTTKLFELAQLAEASYAFLQDAINNQAELIASLIRASGDSQRSPYVIRG